MKNPGSSGRELPVLARFPAAAYRPKQASRSFRSAPARALQGKPEKTKKRYKAVQARLCSLLQHRKEDALFFKEQKVVGIESVRHGNVGKYPIPKVADKVIGNKALPAVKRLHFLYDFPDKILMLFFMGRKVRVAYPLQQFFLRGKMIPDIVHRLMDGTHKIRPGRIVSRKTAPVQGIGHVDKFFMLTVNNWNAKRIALIPFDNLLFVHNFPLCFLTSNQS
jgi:hypothetical protein